MSDRLPPAASSSPDMVNVGAPRSHWGRTAVLLAALGLVIVPLIWSVLPVEVARWFQAGALEAELDEDLPRALRSMDQALSWCATEPDLFAQRASIRLEMGDLEGALVDCNRALEYDPRGSVYALFQRALVYQRQGDHERALADVDTIVDIVSNVPRLFVQSSTAPFVMTYDNALNLRGYARALANRDVAAGLQDIQSAFALSGTEEIAAYLDTRGYLRYLADDTAQADADMQRAVTLAEAALQEYLAAKPEAGDPRIRRQNERRLREDLAVLYQHRGLVAKKLGRQEQAEQDFRRAQEYGYNPAAGIW